MSILIYPGSFDPITVGHMDIIRRAAKLCDRLFVAVLPNSSKQAKFSVAERVEMIRTCIEADAADLVAKVEVDAYHGLLVDYVRKVGAMATVRGIRRESDFPYEAEQVAANRLLYEDYEAILLPCRPDLAFTSSTIVREVAKYGGDISGMVPEACCEYVFNRLYIDKTSAEVIDNGG
ncbi:MAG TPA: pantetheine-phosphate adenylyltransferase [Clostridiaceae bacterium]|nr:pantetheine-phosphate adenylyltransferase [Clostridiaceae bacterium]